MPPPLLPLRFRYAGGSLPTLPRDLGNRLLDIVKLDDYQEPYQALKYAPYYSYSTVVMEMKDMMLNNKGTNNINHSGMRRSNASAPTRAHPHLHLHLYLHLHLHPPARTLPRLRTHTYTYTRIRKRRYAYTLVNVPPRLLCRRWWCCTHIHPGNKAFALTAINTPSPSALAPPLLYHPQRCTRTVQLTRRTIMRYRNSARCPCSIRTPAPAAAGRPSPTPAAIRTASSPRARGARRRRTRR